MVARDLSEEPVDLVGVRHVDLVDGDALRGVVDADVLGLDGVEDGAHAIEILGVSEGEMDAVACEVACTGCANAIPGGDAISVHC